MVLPLEDTNSAARFSFDSRYSIGDFYDGYRRGYTFGPAVRVNEHFNASVNLQVNDIELSNGSFVSTLVIEPRQLQLQHEDVRQRAGAVQHRLAAAAARTCGSTSSTARSATFFLVYNERHDERTDRIDRAFIAKMTYLFAF